MCTIRQTVSGSLLFLLFFLSFSLFKILKIIFQVGASAPSCPPLPTPMPAASWRRKCWTVTVRVHSPASCHLRCEDFFLYQWHIPSCHPGRISQCWRICLDIFRILQWPSLWKESKALVRSIKVMWRSWCCLRHFSWIWRAAKIMSVVPWPARKSHWLSNRITPLC